MTAPYSNDPFPDHEEPGSDASSDRERRLAQALAEFIDLQAHEELVDFESFCRARNDLQPELRAFLETLLEIDQLSQPQESPASEEDSGEFPERLSGHRILSRIGSGGMGRVLLALDERLGRKVAIKTLNRRYRDNIPLRTRFMKEARAMARLSHPNVVRIYNLGLPDEPPHFVMEYLEGNSLTDAARALSLPQKLQLMHKVVMAVNFLHEHQIVHRDLKPGNILVGSDLEPKLLDFGLALQINDSAKLTLAGEIMGTPDYFSPEQARAQEALDSRSDIFSLGTILYELLTGSLPFRGHDFADRSRAIREEEPVLPRRLDPSIPGDLQNICLKALEKNPANRYSSAQEMANDLERFLAGEPVLAVPSSYSRLTGAKIEQHLHELQSWKQDHIVSEYEYDALRKGYDRLVEREDAWIMQVRRLSLAQVTLYLGAWVLVVGAALIFLFRYPTLSGMPAVLLVGAATAATGWLGIRLWRGGRLQISVAYLLAFCLLVPVTLLVIMGEYRIFTAMTQNREDLELFSKSDAYKFTTNAQLWWAIVLSLPAYLWLRRFTRSSVFSLVFAVMGALLCLVTLLRMGMLEWVDKDPGKVYLRLIPFAFLFFVIAIALERFRQEADSRYFYPIAVIFTYGALSGVAAYHKPLADWLASFAPWTRGQVEYFFILNAGIYLILNVLFERSDTPQLRTVAKTFRFVIPGHVMTSLLLLGLAASDLWDKSPGDVALKHEARIFEFLLPIVACLFVFGSIPKHMKNFLASGLVFLAIGIVRLQQDFFKDRAAWPVLLLWAGVLLMAAAANYSSIRMVLVRWARFRP
jgi:serine/threonine-protein kinase